MPAPIPSAPLPQTRIEEMLMQELSIPAHQIGFDALVLALMLCLEREIRYYSIELYPAIARITKQTEDGKAVAEAIHQVILKGYEKGSKAAWQTYFPNGKQAPSNKVFISTLVIWLKRKKSAPPDSSEGAITIDYPEGPPPSG